MLISVDGRGSPTEPLKLTPTSGLTQPAGEASVSPQPWEISQPVVCFQRSATARCTAMPPPTVATKWEKSSSLNPGVFSRH